MRESIPKSPLSTIVLTGEECCFNLQIKDAISNASSYKWEFHRPDSVLGKNELISNSTLLANKKGTICFNDELLEMHVSAGNACGYSVPLINVIEKPLYTGCKNVWTVPNPARNSITIYITNNDGRNYNLKNGHLIITDFFGKNVFETSKVMSPFILDISNFVSGYYSVSFIENKNIFSSSFVKLD